MIEITESTEWDIFKEIFDKTFLRENFMGHFMRHLLIAFEEIWLPVMTFGMVMILMGWQKYYMGPKKKMVFRFLYISGFSWNLN